MPRPCRRGGSDESCGLTRANTQAWTRLLKPSRRRHRRRRKGILQRYAGDKDVPTDPHSQVVHDRLRPRPAIWRRCLYLEGERLLTRIGQQGTGTLQQHPESLLQGKPATKEKQ